SRPGRYSDRSVLPCGPRVSFAKTPAPPARTRRTVSEAQEASRRPSSGAPPHDEHQHAALLRPRGVPSPARSEGPSPALHRPGLRDRDGPVLRFGRRDPGRRPLRAAGVPAGRRGRVLHAARARGDGGADADLGLLRRVHPPLPGSLGRVHHRVAVRLRDADRVPGERAALALYTPFWFPDTAQWVWVAATLLIVGAANLASVRWFGELEFAFTIVKVGAVVAMIAGGAAILAFGLGDAGTPTGLSNLTADGGFF